MFKADKKYNVWTLELSCFLNFQTNHQLFSYLQIDFSGILAISHARLEVREVVVVSICSIITPSSATTNIVIPGESRTVLNSIHETSVVISQRTDVVFWWTTCSIDTWMEFGARFVWRTKDILSVWNQIVRSTDFRFPPLIVWISLRNERRRVWRCTTVWIFRNGIWRRGGGGWFLVLTRVTAFFWSGESIVVSAASRVQEWLTDFRPCIKIESSGCWILITRVSTILWLSTVETEGGNKE